MVNEKVELFPEAEWKIKVKLGLQVVLANILVLCYYEGMIRLPLGDFGAIVFSSPVFTMIMSSFMLKD